jgi:hypothetical protein
MPPNDYQLFVSMDLLNSFRLCEEAHPNLVEGKGRSVSVSAHIRGWSTNPREVLHRIRHFRRLVMRQQTEMDNCSDAPCEKKKHNKNIEELSLKLKLINREVEWEAVKPEFETHGL